jgi:hypothetical protein
MLPLGFVTKDARTVAQNIAHELHESRMSRFMLTVPNNAGPLNIRLFDAWKHPKVVQDVGFVFPRFHQLTGSCVGAGGGQALFTLIAMQRLLATDPTVAFLPFWPFDYGRCRSNEGDRGQGEGAMGSSFADTIVKEGVIDAKTQGLPAFTNNDGLVLTSKQEMQWSDGNSSLVTQYLPAARVHPMGTSAPLNDTAGMKAAIINGFPGSFACDYYIGNASVQGSGANAAVVGHWDGRGGHQQSFHGYWDNPDLGPLFWIQNNWPGSTYPADPSGGPTCGCWVTEANVTKAFGYNSEVYAFSHLNWFPAQPDVPAVLDWSTL